MKFLFVLFLCFSAAVFARAERVVVLAGSDFQAKSDAEGAKTVGKILSRIRADGYSDIDRVLFCGDYTTKLNNRPSESESGIAALTQALFSSQLGINAGELVLLRGNHDPVGTQGVSPKGANDPAHGRYGVFVIHEDDYMWFQGKHPSDGNSDTSDDKATVKATAGRLDAYLSQKHKENFTFPIFVCSHLPLHYSMRSYNDSDGRYAKYIFDVLNHHAERGLNLFFLYGHNHSNGWDNYLGGGRVFLRPGSKLPVAVPENRKRCTIEKLSFTYMNAGYTGYVSTTDSHDGADRTLSMSIFEIDGHGNVSVKRYSPDGECPLKAPGVPNTRNDHQERKLGLY